ncbi:UDP-N-acetylglucosamine--N-acetylmuramyl-(pentapeptide) pyrophosphoryl-undecaprenol N-acetylglucosamine transferase [Chthoniobacter flavus Ellin428]|uniref:UDP-N-acetylglucosamine--N-acetylmuramyl-(pentapeptide) pyrophosphoryl-undecaprenol N-acetylglucosamine transferase n=1 Tax=Chthoniobacter flavus Ellin428 TaxID=497964 RepID=B4D1Z5_9BACT|nr:undecaprenyldiphospho-muramoylpentapeptide beta-N-acetylglucosaminyltransferase [Chthoniobacter flavus]EDY19757.1 UDP-N-acetylglucosamine--N-acetylmuramyl-(pentapeptide) pyrophosphoryl-undecaprenol N-acetylglucosamine transferase [Chthoniobacter flavus Ellin428]TCO92991.1 UDP-N-acetylglucosamine-N-acetylmuramylpentapeptide N-acetylglucosamine transferase [Chthoniobacter flavus]
MNFVIAAGGTGGHLFPGLAVGEVLIKRGHQVMLIISEKEIDSLATQGRTDFRIERVPGVGLQSKNPIALVKFLLKFRAGLAQVKALYRDFQPQAVLGMGGFTSTAPLLAGRAAKVPTFVHESNAIPGKSNKFNGRIVTRVLLGFEECAQFFPPGKCTVTGTPIRTSLATRLDQTQALAAFGLTPGKPTLLVMGGSQGAHGINQSLVNALPSLAQHPLQVIHLTGKQDEQLMRESYARAGIPAFVAAFYHRMEEAYSAADFAISRSGAASLTELSHFALPSILIPYPFAAEDHQTFNANIFEKRGAATLLKERETSGETLAQKLLWFLEDPQRLSDMSARSASLAPQQAAERVADTILNSCA